MLAYTRFRTVDDTSRLFAMARRQNVSGRSREFWAQLGCLNPEDVRTRISAEVDQIMRAVEPALGRQTLARMLKVANARGGLAAIVGEAVAEAEGRLAQLGELTQRARRDHARLHRLYSPDGLGEGGPCRLSRGVGIASSSEDERHQCPSKHPVVEAHAQYTVQLFVRVGYEEVGSALSATLQMDRAVKSPDSDNLPSVASTLHDLGLTDEDVALLLLFHGEWSGGQTTPDDGTDAWELVRKKTSAVKSARAAYRRG